MTFENFPRMDRVCEGNIDLRSILDQILIDESSEDERGGVPASELEVQVLERIFYRP
jgi:hypothetical protein